MSHPLFRNCFVALLAVFSVTLMTGCTGVSPGGNQAPTANAGPNQSVLPNVAVTLSGSGTDANGDTLSFAWTQTGGTTVVLSNANTATASFTAPAAVGTLTFQLTVDDGHGGSDTDTATVTITTAPVTPRLFIANFTGNNITSYANPATVNGNIAPDTNLAGANTQLNNPSDIVVSSGGALIASNFNAAALSITSYDDAGTSNGNLVPDRNVQGANTQLIGGPTSLAINAASDLLFVSKLGATPAILVYSSVSNSGFTGNLAPTRTITTAGILTSPFGINLDNSGNLYVANNGTSSILVYANAANLNGDIAPTRTITGNPAFTNVFDVFVDNNDRMYVVNGTGGTINIFNHASTLNGAVAPDFTLTIPGAIALTAIAIDSAGRGYIVDNIAARIFSYDGIATLNGTLSPTRTIAGSNTQLNNPIRLFLVE